MADVEDGKASELLLGAGTEQARNSELGTRLPFDGFSPFPPTDPKAPHRSHTRPPGAECLSGLGAKLRVLRVWGVRWMSGFSCRIVQVLTSHHLDKSWEELKKPPKESNAFGPPEPKELL